MLIAAEAEAEAEVETLAGIVVVTEGEVCLAATRTAGQALETLRQGRLSRVCLQGCMLQQVSS